MVSACFVLSAGDFCLSYRQISFCLCWPQWPEWLAVVQQRGFFSSSLVKLRKLPALLNFFPQTVTTVNCFNLPHNSILLELTEAGEDILILFAGNISSLSPITSATHFPACKTRHQRLSAVSASICCMVSHLISWHKKVVKRKQIKSEFPSGLLPYLQACPLSQVLFSLCIKMTKTSQAPEHDHRYGCQVGGT